MPGTHQQITESSVSTLPSRRLCLLGKVLPFILLSGYTHTELFLLSFLAFIKDVPDIEDTVVNKIDNTLCGADI